MKHSPRCGYIGADNDPQQGCTCAGSTPKVIEPTPVPWMADRCDILTEDRSTQVAFIASGDAKVSTDQDEANAEFIVRAANNYEKLIRALRQLRIDANRLCDRNEGGTYEDDCRRSIKAADDAIHKAIQPLVVAILMALGTVANAEPITVTIGSSFSAPVDLFGGVTESDRRTRIVRVGTTRVLGCAQSRVSAAFAVVPLEIQTNTPPGGSVYGFGVDPLGISVRLGPAFVTGRGGVRWFTRAVPIPEGQRFNFTFDVEAGVRVGPISVGLDFHHVSNGGLGERNPGVNYLMLTIGI